MHLSFHLFFFEKKKIIFNPPAWFSVQKHFIKNYKLQKVATIDKIN